MGILIAIVGITLVVAAIGAGVYVIIFRAKHKKEVMANSQVMGGGVPVYGQPQGQQPQGQPDFTNNMAADMSQPSPAPSPMMNDITGNGSTNDTLAGMSQVPQPPLQEPSDEAPQEAQPSISRDFAPETTQPEVPTAPVVETPTLDNTLDLNQFGSQNDGGGNIFDDTQTVAPISEMAKEDMGQTPDGDMADFSVPVTTESESLSQVESELGEAAVSTQTEEKVEQNTMPEPPVVSPEVQTEPISSPEPPSAPETSMPTDASVPQPSIENAAPVSDGVVGGQDTDTKEMHI